MTAATILGEIKPLGSEAYRQVLLNHGANEPCFGVKIEVLKQIQKRIKKDYRLALELYETGVYDAMYLAGLIADDAQMTKDDLRRWAHAASRPLAGSTIPWVAAGSPHAWEMALEWIESEKELVAAAGWATLGSMVAVTDDKALDLTKLRSLLKRVQLTIHNAPHTVRYSMNAFLIAAGCHVKVLTAVAREIGEKIGRLNVDMGNTSCQVPFAPDYIAKVEKRGAIGQKRKTAKC